MLIMWGSMYISTAKTSRDVIQTCPHVEPKVRVHDALNQRKFEDPFKPPPNNFRMNRTLTENL